jgi:hypothetical protein
MTGPDISNLPAADLLALKTAIDARLEEIKQEHVLQAEALGLHLVSDNGKPRKRRANASSYDTQ